MLEELDAIAAALSVTAVIILLIHCLTSKKKN